MSAPDPTHLRVPYHRPTAQGGDTAHPLCLMPLFGWAGPEAASLAMRGDIAEVKCRRCRLYHAAGGARARLDHLADVILGRDW